MCMLLVSALAIAGERVTTEPGPYPTTNRAGSLPLTTSLQRRPLRKHNKPSKQACLLFIVIARSACNYCKPASTS